MIEQPAVLDEQRQMTAAVGGLAPAVAVAGRGELERLCRFNDNLRAAHDFGAEEIEPAVLDSVFQPCVLAVQAVAPVSLHGDHGLGNRHGVFGRAKAHQVGGARVGVLLAVGHSHPAANGHIPPCHAAFVVEDCDEAEIMREHVDIVGGRHRHHDLEFARQVGLAVDRLHHVVLTAGDALAVEPDFAVGRCLRRQVIRDLARQFQRGRMGRALLGVGAAHHVAVDVAAGRNRIQQRRIDFLQRRFQVRFDDAVQLYRLPRGQPHGVVAVVARHLVEREPLRRRQHAAGNAHADHEGEGLLHLLSGALGPQVAVVLQIHAVELHQLLVVLDDGAGDFLR